jgi:diaminopimelate decarboxylase
MLEPLLTSQAQHPLVLRPLLHPLLQELMAQKQLLRELASGMGSPLNIMLPEVLGPNVDSFAQVLARHEVMGKIFFAHKSTASDSLVRQLASTDVFIDVADMSELAHSLACGFSGRRIEATGPKSRDREEFLRLCLLHDVTVNLDSLTELHVVAKIRRFLRLDRKATVLLRLSGFDKSPHARASRFGVPIEHMPDAFQALRAAGDDVSLLGFAFHLDTVERQERVDAIEAVLDLFERAVDMGFQPKAINIGGGFRINYLAHEEDWSRYTTALKQSVLGLHPSITWQRAGFGLSVEKGQLRGALNTEEYYQSRPGALFLDDILRSPLPSRADKTVGEVLASNMIELWLEPGRSIIDQAGFTLARVSDVRQSSKGEWLVLLEMSRRHATFLDQEVFVDPLVLPSVPDSAASAVPVYFAGSCCLESDLIHRHLTYLPQLPQAGDLLIFVNTAAYMMDFATSGEHSSASAKKIVICRNNAGFDWFLDSQYSPVWSLNRKDSEHAHY